RTTAARRTTARRATARARLAHTRHSPTLTLPYGGEHAPLVPLVPCPGAPRGSDARRRADATACQRTTRRSAVLLADELSHRQRRLLEFLPGPRRRTDVRIPCLAAVQARRISGPDLPAQHHAAARRRRCPDPESAGRWFDAVYTDQRQHVSRARPVRRECHA